MNNMRKKLGLPDLKNAKSEREGLLAAISRQRKAALEYITSPPKTFKIDHPKYLKEKKYLELNIIKSNKQQEILNSIYSFGDDESRKKHRHWLVQYENFC